MIGVGVIGYGYWGPKVLRALASTAGCRVVMVTDLRGDRLRAAQVDHPAIDVSTDARQVLRDQRVDAVVIATPAASHFCLVQAALTAGRHVWVEKPLTATLGEAQSLAEAVERCGRLLMVDHTFVYSGAVHALRELMARSLPLSYESVRINGGVRRDDVNVIWDLAVHDFSIIDLVMPAAPCAISASARTHDAAPLEEAAQLRLWFGEPLEARVTVDWLGAAKTRRTQVRSNQRTIIYDDCEAREKIRVYEHGTVAADPQRGPAVPLDLTEPLRAAAEHFVRCIATGERPASDVHAGLRMVHWLDAATRSMRDGGRPIELPPRGAAG